MDEEKIEIEDGARIAVYDDLLSAPRVVDIPPQEVAEFIEAITVAAYELSHQQGGLLPYVVIREITENFIHAGFLECTVSILDEGNTLRFADQGPGIPKKDLVLRPGVSSATRKMKEYIRGVGSGFPVVREYLSASHGYLAIEDNAGDGVVVTISLVPDAPGKTDVASPAAGTRDALYLPSAVSSFTASPVSIQTVPGIKATPVPTQAPSSSSPYASAAGDAQKDVASKTLDIKLDEREEQSLLLLREHGMLGPVDLAKILGYSPPTTTRLLKRLEQLELVESTPLRKRILSNAGMAYIQEHLL
ncbi:MAG: ATP-binding protein [Coriobacteriales bacterium]|jgi:hypothetical protein|nr:ATP-binding protein [Coriobacteriales bacterium]